MAKHMTPDWQALLHQMRDDWDQRARENARYYVATGSQSWADEAFFRTGWETVNGDILQDAQNVCQGCGPKQMRVLEIGCGVGRITRSLAGVFGEVHAVDVSGEMVKLARQTLMAYPNVFVYQNNGTDLAVVPELPFDFEFSAIVFQHIPSRAVIENYIREVGRLLRPGALFKFQVQGGLAVPQKETDTWLGVSISSAEAQEMAERTGFELRYEHGAGEQYYWLWFFKR